MEPEANGTRYVHIVNVMGFCTITGLGILLDVLGSGPGGVGIGTASQGPHAPNVVTDSNSTVVSQLKQTPLLPVRPSPGSQTADKSFGRPVLRPGITAAAWTTMIRIILHLPARIAASANANSLIASRVSLTVYFSGGVMPRLLRAFITALTIFHMIGVARADDPLWLKYRQAVEQIKDFECEYRLLSPPTPGRGLLAERGAIDGGNGLLVEAKYSPFRWSAFRNRVYFEESRFEGNYYPPNDWRNRIIFYDGDTSGLYRAFQKSGEIRDAPPEEVALFPNPASFLKPLNKDLAAIEAAGDWMIPSHSDNRLELETKFGGFSWKYEIELDPEHGFLPKSFKAIPLGAPMSYNNFINEEFQNVDGIWFPVKSRLEYYRGTALGPILETVRVVEVIPSTLRVNQSFTAKDFQFRFPENIHFENEITGEVRESPEAYEYARAFLSAPKRESLPATPMPSEVRKAWINRASWVTTGVFAVLTLIILAWNSRRILRWVGIATAGLVLTTLSGIGCGSHVSSDQASEIELAISELLRTETVAKDGIVVKISQR